MSGNRRIAGFDIGTSSLKVTLADYYTGRITEELKYEYHNFRELAPGVVPVVVYEETLLKALKELYYSIDIVSLALTTQMYSICENKDGEWIAHQWNSLWDRNPDIEKVLQDPLRKSGCQVDTLFPAYKLKTLSEEKRKNFVPYGIKEHLIYFLTGKLATDYVTASASGLFDISARIWNIPFVKSLGMDTGKLPEVLPHDKPVGKIKPGLFPGVYSETLVVPGLGDGPSASFACKGISNFCGNLGTSMAARVFTRKPDLLPEHGLWNFVVDDDTFVTGGISSNSCTVFHWAERMGIKIGSSISDTRDVMFFPWIHGERMPYWSSDLRGTITGMRIDDGPSVLAGAIIKAVAFTFVRMTDILVQHSENGKPLVIAGGGTNLAPILDIIAGCIDTDLALLQNAEYLCSTGAAISAGNGVGINVEPDFQIERIIKPSKKYREEYEMWLAQASNIAAIYS